MTFLKLRCETAYATGAIRTPLTMREFAAKMRRIGMQTSISSGALSLNHRGDHWTFADWLQSGSESVGWLRFTTEGDLSGLSRALAAAGVRHRFEYSRPRDLDTDDVRCITSYDHRWNDYSTKPADPVPAIETYDEPV
jgi:hypothetical protein